ncbi:MAG: hypothetical protein KGQ59_02080 [Bdellovibrionales bacterium]|nr:hypothetical protein [Bdellovibrionales bacterium]
MTLSRRAFWRFGQAASWEELWDASQYFDRFSELVEDAEHWVLIVGWQLDSRLPLLRPNRLDPLQPPAYETLREKLLRLCQSRPHLRFYLLLWDHPSFYIPQREWLQTRVWEELHPHVHLVFDSRHSFGVSHHEKIVMIDGRFALTGGVDLCADRWDSPQHLVRDPRRSLDRHHEVHGPYHELGVQVSGPICSLIHQHLRRRWRLLSTIPFPDPMIALPEHTPEQGHRVWLSRTRSSVDPGESHHPIVREIEFLFRDLILNAQSEIWMEGQYFWSRHVASALQQRIQRATTPLKITLILADLSNLKMLAARMSGYQAQLLAELERAALKKTDLVRLQVYRPYTKSRPIYVHSKLLLTDDQFISIGSANFSARALRMDSELMLTFEATNENEKKHIARFKKNLSRHWDSLSLSKVDSITEATMITQRDPVLSRIAWHRCVDPEIPYFHRFKRRIYARLEKRTTRYITQVAAIVISWTLGFTPLAIFFYPKSTHLGLLGWMLCALIFSVWLMPVPFIALILAAPLQMESRIASEVVVLSWWMAGIVSISWGRVFPSILKHWTTRRSPIAIRDFGKRKFVSALRAWINPRFRIYDKLLWQSQYWIPIPWFILIHGMIISSILFWIVKSMNQVVR